MHIVVVTGVHAEGSLELEIGKGIMPKIPSCSKCGNSYFELADQVPSGSNYKLKFVQCSSCNATAGVMDFYNLGQMLKEQQELLEEINSRLSSLEETVAGIDKFIRSR
jgi:hypothetical protein